MKFEGSPIEFQNVSRRFGEQEVLRGVSLAVAPGQVYALLGRNGAGKTTLMNILLGFLAPQEGSTRLLGCDSRELTPELRERVGLVTEGHRMYTWMTVAEVLDFEQGTRTRFQRDLAERSIERLELPRRGLVSKLSRGMRAQLALVLALAADPEVLVLDDPGMGLDAVMRRVFLDAMIDLLGEEGRSVLFSSHILSDVERIADRVGILDRGRLIVDATLDDLRGRVQKRFLGRGGRATSVDELQRLPGVLRARSREGGFELTLLDCDAEREAALLACGERLSAPRPTNLEELFLDLTTRDSEAHACAAMEVAS